MAFVGEALVSATLQVLFDRLASPEVVNFFRGRKQDEELPGKLNLALLTVNAAINDAEDKEITNPAVKDWLDELKNVIYHADDLLDEIATEAMLSKFEAESHCSTNQIANKPMSKFEALQSKFEAWRSNFEAESQSSTNQVRNIASLDDEMKKIIGRLEYFAERKDVLGLKDVERKQSKRLPTTSLVDEDAVYGRDDDREKIIKLLLCDDEGANNEIRVIPIVGMGGIGKTTLAQYAYNDRRVDEHFHIKAWVCVSEEFDIFMVTKTILAAVTSSANSDVTDLNQLQVKLKGELSGKKFLIVLDDVWNHNYENWDKLRCPFRGGAQGSKIIVTARNQSVASIMQTVPTHRLELLSDEDCWSLFAKHAFGNGDPGARPNLESIGKDIVKKCKGLPLAVKTLGGVLRSKLEIEEWENILKSSIWDLPQDKNNVPPVLRLSYHYLHSNLKRCFAYCSIFPKDYEFEKEKLVLLWIAEDLVEQAKGDKVIEREGENYFNELLSRSFFQQSSANKSYFVMHDLIHDLAQLISGEFCYRLEHGKACNVSEKVRHFSYSRALYDTFDKFKVINEVKYLRTFIAYNFSQKYGPWSYLSNKVLHDILPSLSCLRVLSLSHYNISELPHSIGNLIHLRYLDLSHMMMIERLPDSITTLWNLQTLDLSGCSSITQLPADMGKLINLRYLGIKGTKLIEMPRHMSRIKGLQHLSAFVVGKDSGTQINELRELCHLHGTLSIQGLQNVTNSADALKANLKDKKQLANLELRWSGETSDTQNERDVLDKLQPHARVKNLTIENYGGTRFPDWLGQPLFLNLVFLFLRNCENCISLPPLGQLPSLEDLKIEGMNGITRVGAEFYGNTSRSMSIKPFQSLKILRFEKMKEWEEWCTLGVGKLRRLVGLYIIECPKLTTGDFHKHISSRSLKWLEISGCQQLVLGGPMTNSILSNRVGLRLRVLEISNMLKLQELPWELCRLKNLEKLSIKGCPNLESFSEHDSLQSPPEEGMARINTCLEHVGLPTTLKMLSIKNCGKLEFPLSLSEQCSSYTSLDHLSIENSCEDSLKSLPLGFFPKLRFLSISGCTNLETLSVVVANEIQNLASLDYLSIECCPNMVSFSRGGLPAPNLTSIYVRNCKKLKSLPEGMHTLLPSLQYLGISECPEVESFPEGGLPSNLHGLSIVNCKKLTNNRGIRMEWSLQRLPYLNYFSIGGDDSLEESFPHEERLLPSTLTSLEISHLPNLKSLNHKALQHLTSLRTLVIRDCPDLQSLPEECLPTSTLTKLHIWNLPNLKSLNHKALQHLTSLRTLLISNCPNLQSLPEEGLPTSLSQLTIYKCPLLKARCQRKKGEDW